MVSITPPFPEPTTAQKPVHRDTCKTKTHTEPHAPHCACIFQAMRESEDIPIEWGAYHRSETGWSENPDRCMMIELGEDVVSPFSYLQADNTSTPFARWC